jgi:alpha/beta superfamily hydrolase
MGLPVGEEDPRVTRLIGIGLPLDLREFSLSPVGQKPILVIQGTRDEFARTETARTWARARGASTELLLLETDHFFGEKLAEVEESVRGFARI